MRIKCLVVLGVVVFVSFLSCSQAVSDEGDRAQAREGGVRTTLPAGITPEAATVAERSANEVVTIKQVIEAGGVISPFKSTAGIIELKGNGSGVRTVGATLPTIGGADNGLVSNRTVDMTGVSRTVDTTPITAPPVRVVPDSGSAATLTVTTTITPVTTGETEASREAKVIPEGIGQISPLAPAVKAAPAVRNAGIVRPPRVNFTPGPANVRNLPRLPGTRSGRNVKLGTDGLAEKLVVAPIPVPERPDAGSVNTGATIEATMESTETQTQ